MDVNARGEAVRSHWASRAIAVCRELGTAILLCGVFWTLQPAAAQQTEYRTIVIREGQLLRDIAAEYLGDPDLWPEIIQASGLESPAAVRAGMKLRIPHTRISLANNALRQALDKTQQATALGARVFAPELITRAITLRGDALAQRRVSDWQRCLELARQAETEADKAYQKTLKQRDAAAQAILNSRLGYVQSRRPAQFQWQHADEGTVLVEKEKLRTLSESYAEVLFVDESELRLGPNSQAVIQKMRMDLLNRRQEASVTLVEGDVYALLGGSPTRRTLEVAVPGVTSNMGSADFWISRKGTTTKIANYDETEMLVASAGKQVALLKSQGTIIERQQAPSAPRDLLSAPELLEPVDDLVAVRDEVVLRWSEVSGARSYQLEVAIDANFRRLIIKRLRLRVGQKRLEELFEGDYYWRVSAVDGLGFPGARSQVRRFRIRYDRAAPYFAIWTPQEQAILRVSPVRITGIADTRATLRLNGKPAELDAQGAFAEELALVPGLNAFVLELSDASGNISRGERTVIYMPDRPARIVYDDALSNTGLLKTGERSFLTRSDRFILAGHTIPKARIEVNSTTGAFAARSSADEAGAFRVYLSLDGDRDEFRLRVTAPSGYVTEDRFAVIRDNEPPTLDLEPVTNEARLTLRGRVTGSASLTLNGEDVAVDNGAVELGLDLVPGENRIEVVARDRVGNKTHWQRTVFLDQDPPALLDHSVSQLTAAGAEGVEIAVRAADASGLKRAARFVLRISSSTQTGTLVLDPITQTYRGMVTLPRQARGPIALQSVILEDYTENRQIYRF